MVKGCPVNGLWLARRGRWTTRLLAYPATLVLHPGDAEHGVVDTVTFAPDFSRSSQSLPFPGLFADRDDELGVGINDDLVVRGVPVVLDCSTVV